MTDADTIRERHHANSMGPTVLSEGKGGRLCWGCRQPWPCHTATVLGLLDKAEVDAERLAVALGDAHAIAHHVSHSICPEGCQSRAALKAHEERVKP